MDRESLFLAWLRDAPSGLGFAYHRGHLATDRKIDPSLDSLASTVYQRSDLEIPIVPPKADYHIRAYEQGTGEVRLMTERSPGGGFLYIAVKR